MSLLENEKIAVVVPAYNEPGIGSTLQGLYDQESRPENIHHFIVDNASTDDTRKRIDAFIKSHDDFPVTVLDEGQKGTGAAVDTGFREAIDQGYTLVARTDSDTVPAPSWTSRIENNFRINPELELLGGNSLPLKDEQYRFGDTFLIPAAVNISRFVLAIKNVNPRYLKAVVGHNMATRSGAYIATGGFERASIDQIDEDVDYSLKVAAMYGLKSIKIDPSVEVQTSTRRIRKYGFGGTALHHLYPGLRKYRKNGVDVR